MEHQTYKEQIYDTVVAIFKKTQTPVSISVHKYWRMFVGIIVSNYVSISFM